MDNREIARRLQAYAHELDAEHANLHERRAYRQAAEAMLRLERPAADIVAAGGRKELEALPGIGSHLSFTIEVLIRTGEFRTHPRSRGRRRSAAAFPTAHSYVEPGVGVPG
jgi:DNA polymerase/3'-5' exonuclease PolX